MRTILNKIKHEPAILIGLVVAVLVAIQAALAAGTPLTWPALVPIVVGVVTRFFVTPAHEVVVATSSPVVPVVVAVPEAPK